MVRLDGGRLEQYVFLAVIHSFIAMHSALNERKGFPILGSFGRAGVGAGEAVGDPDPIPGRIENLGRGRMSARNNCAGSIALFILAVFPVGALANRSGPIPGLTGSIASNGLNCTGCHSNATGGSGSVQILGVPPTYQFNQIYNLTVRISDPVQSGAGFQMSVEDAVGMHVGTLILADATNTQLNIHDSRYVNHTETGVDNSVANWNGSADYVVDWQAPSSDIGPITFWASGNAINNNFLHFGDHVYKANVVSNPPPPIPAVSPVGVFVLVFGCVLSGAALLRRRERSAAGA